MSPENLILSTPSSQPENQVLRQAWEEEIIKQSDRFDDLAKELLKLELGIPALFVTLIKLAMGSQPIAFDWWIASAFLLWLSALALTLWALFPKKEKVYSDLIDSDENTPKGALTIRGFYEKSARRKFWALLISSVSFFAGFVVAFVYFSK